MKTGLKILLTDIILVLLAFFAGCSSSEAVNSGSSNLSPGEKRYASPLPGFKPVSLAWFYHAPPEGVDPALLARYFDLFVSTRELASGRDRLRSLGSEAVFLQYIVLNETIQPDSCDEKPYDNQAAFKPGDYCTIDRLHPDWFLKSASGERIHDQPPYEKSWFMDPSNPDWRLFWITRALERDFSGWDGVFIDNLEARPRYEEQHLQQFQSLDEFQNANLEFLGQIYRELRPKNIRVFANILNAATPEEWQLFLPYLDGVMIENFAVDWESGDYLTVEQWEMQMQAAISAQAAGKEMILVARGDPDDFARQKFTLASYFLVNNGRAYFRYTGNKYDELLWFMNYLAEPGAPLGDVYFEDGLWKRAFENGQVTVDPDSHLAEIEFN